MAVVQTLREYDDGTNIWFVMGRYKNVDSLFRLWEWSFTIAGSDYYWWPFDEEQTEEPDSLLPIYVNHDYLNQYRDVGVEEDN